MMQAGGKGIAMRPEHRKGGGTDPAHPGIKKMAEIVAVADFAPAVRRRAQNATHAQVVDPGFSCPM